MAYLEYPDKDIDYSIPYKTFNELKDQDTIFVIDITNIEYKEYKIDKYSKREVKAFRVLNKFEVEFIIPELDKYENTKIYDGNSYLAQLNYKRNEIFIATDERIANMIKHVIHSRNAYQWSTFSSIFGHPLSGRFEPRHIVLR